MKLETITAANFAPFGTVLELDPAGENPVFQIPVRVSDAPWRLALLKILPREITQLERHCTSRESFEPLSGCAVLFAAPAENPAAVRAFVLDRPVCLYAGVWHGVVTLSAESLCKLTENLEVDLDYTPLPSPLTVAAVGG